MERSVIVKRLSRKTTLLKLGVFLLLFLAGGAIVNAAVAWGCMLWSHRGTKEEIPDEAIEELERSYAPPDWIRETWRCKRFVFTGKVVDNVGGAWPVEADLAEDNVQKAYVSSIPAPSPRGIGRMRAGWPMLSLQHVIVIGTEGHQSYFRFSPQVSVPFIGLSSNEAFSLGPLWPGFAINTIFYAAILWLLWIAPGRIRRFVRVQRWRCPACAYFIAPGTCANGLCSECGATLPLSLVRERESL